MSNNCRVGWGDNKLPTVLYGAMISEEILYADIWSIDPTKIIEINLPIEAVEKIGSINAKLLEYADFELLVRAVKLYKKCSVIYVEETIERHVSDGLATVYAYMVRSHVDYWREIDATERLLQRVYANAKQLKIFEQFQKELNLFISDKEYYQSIACNTAPFLVLRGDDTCGRVLQKFADDIAESLVNNGQSVIVLGDDKESDYDSLSGTIFKGIVGFQTRALEIDFFRKLNGPKYQFWMDYPLHFKGVLRNLPEDYFVLCQDADYAELICDHYNTLGAMHFPLGGVNNNSVDGIGITETYADRPYDIVFIGGYFENNCDCLNGKSRQFYEYMLLHPEMTFDEGLIEMNGYSTEEVASESFIDELCELKTACRSIIGYFRNKVVETILSAGYSIHVYGEDWKNYKGEAADKLIIHPHVSVDESIEELKKTKIGLNVMSWHKAGMTERIANIILSGAVCLTDETDYINANFKNGEDCAIFKLNAIDEIPGIIAKLLGDVGNSTYIVQKAYKKAVESYTWDARSKELIRLAENYADKRDRVRIFVATHVKFNPPKNPIYVPLHVGREGKINLGYLGDNTGNNISDLNFLYGELTGLFWIWQNIENVDYVGLCHYRRYFINDKMRELREEECLSILNEYDAIVPKHAECEPDYYEHFGRAHNKHDLDAVEHALKRLYPGYAEAYDTAMEGKIFYGGNLMVTRLDILKEYAEWLFNIFIEAGEEIDVSGYDAYHARVYGFLSEQMFYVFAKTNGLRLCEVQVGISEEKAETKELITELKRLIDKGEKTEAKKLIDEKLKVRPDLLLPGSDINEELKVIISGL